MQAKIIYLFFNIFFFFFQAEDGIRDRLVTGVQTCVFRSSAVNKTEPGPSITPLIVP